MDFDQNTIIAGVTVAFALIVAIFYLFGSANEEVKVEEKPVEIKTYTAADVAEHNTENDAWIIVDGKVYDITYYATIHPGGESILKNVGGDSSKGVHGPQHPVTVWDVLANYYIGELVQE